MMKVLNLNSDNTYAIDTKNDNDNYQSNLVSTNFILIKFE